MPLAPPAGIFSSLFSHSCFGGVLLGFPMGPPTFRSPFDFFFAGPRSYTCTAILRPYAGPILNLRIFFEFPVCGPDVK